MFEKGMRAGGGFYEVVEHSLEAVVSSQYLANFFVQEARKNSHAYSSPDELQGDLLYGRATSTVAAPGFTEVYLLFSEGNKEIEVQERSSLE